MDSLRMVDKEELDLAITIYEADYCSGFFVNKMIYRAFASEGIKPNIILCSAQLHTVKNLVNKRIASTFLMREAVIDDFQIVAIPFSTSLKIRAGIVTKQSRQIYSDVKKLIDFLKEKFTEEVI